MSTYYLFDSKLRSLFAYLLSLSTSLVYCIQVVCTEGPDRIRELIAMGASFDHGEDGNLHLAREGGHSHHRIVHAADMTGREIERALLEAVVNDPNISVFEHHFAIDLLTSQVHFSSGFLVELQTVSRPVLSLGFQ